ncbi:hypothetical protein [Nannocystis punicea]|uniref:Uncharacterized protein n=1 Tax=Nannocystis punicea TaxID=2995304 RepID=A0ABY7H9S9_9BACT|nr:hypothetical protein [Nannocystis poenicansa]WAS95852.1 hypothetical protein O0S08_06785 [Nannocystis poenicansa]
MLARGQAARRVMVAWGEGLYDVAFIDSPFEFSEPARIDESAVLRVAREYLARLVEA